MARAVTRDPVQTGSERGWTDPPSTVSSNDRALAEPLSRRREVTACPRAPEPSSAAAGPLCAGHGSPPRDLLPGAAAGGAGQGAGWLAADARANPGRGPAGRVAAEGPRSRTARTS